MAEKPLLLFPRFEKASKSKLPGRQPVFRSPSHSQQGERLAPLFQRLRDAFNKRRIEILSSNAGLEPEQIIVIETIGDVANFLTAVSKIKDLEWMGELAIDNIAPDEDFYFQSSKEKTLTGKLYMIMANQQALDELLSLWEKYKTNENFEFRRGFTKFRDIFDTLKDIRRWDVRDRLDETGVIESWNQDLIENPDAVVFFETELWFRSDNSLRMRTEQLVTKIIESNGGQVINRCVIEEIAYHAILAQLPSAKIREIIENPSTELVKCDNIMFFRPTGQMAAIKVESEGEAISELMPSDGGATTDREPIVAILDGMPMENHPALQGRLLIDDPDNFGSSYPVADRIHGTSMASLIIHGDLTEKQKPISRRIYVRPILQPSSSSATRRQEILPKNVLATDVIHRSVKRLFDSESGRPPTGSTIKIINLSIGDPDRPFVREISPLARLIDWLSEKYKILFVVSAGNHTKPIELPITGGQLSGLNSQQLQELIIEGLYSDRRLRRILSPAESINALTVGASHFDNSVPINNRNHFDPFTDLLPSPSTSFGTGHRKSVKPDIIFKGGKVLFPKPVLQNNPAILEPLNYRLAPGIKSAFPGPATATEGQFAYSRGTSNAAALITREAMLCHDALIDLLAENGKEGEASTSLACLLKAMIVHGCTWSESATNLTEILEKSSIGKSIVERVQKLYPEPHVQKLQINRALKSIVASWVGYGIPAPERIAECTDHRVSLLGFGDLKHGQAHVYKLPLPPSLDLSHEWRRLTVTLGWLSPIQGKNTKYRTAGLWFEVDKDKIGTSRTDAQWQTVRNGTIQHETFDGSIASHFSDGEFIEIKINCREDATKLVGSVSYGLAVTLEVADGSPIKIYDEIRIRLQTQIQIQA